MSIKLHFLKSHIDYFPENLGDISEEQGERFHQDIRVMEERYQGRWDCHMMADYCWNLKRESSTAVHKIFKFMMTVTYLFYQMQCARDYV